MSHFFIAHSAINIRGKAIMFYSIIHPRTKVIMQLDLRGYTIEEARQLAESEPPELPRLQEPQTELEKILTRTLGNFIAQEILDQLQ